MFDCNKTTPAKTSLSPISTPESSILILGTLPGEVSLRKQEYYAHPMNKFWKIVAGITQHAFPQTYAEKRVILSESNIAVWDVVHQAEREGSLDIHIKNETPNDLDEFIREHKRLRTIAFNGQKAEKLFDKYFERKAGIEYISLPSTSPANTRYTLNDLQHLWSAILAV